MHPTEEPDRIATAPGGMMKDPSLPLVQAGGFTVSADAFVWESDSDPSDSRMRLWFLSLLGPHQALKAIWARLVKGELVTVSREALGQVRFCTLAPDGPKGWRSYTANLPGAAGHQLVLLPEVARHATAREDFLLLPRTENDSPSIHFRFLDRHVDLPLHPSWCDWLWERALRSGEAVPLEAEGIVAYRCLPNPDALADDLSAAIRERTLTVPNQTVGSSNGTTR